MTWGPRRRCRRISESTATTVAPSVLRHFFAAAAEAMRRILIENARRKASQKRGDGMARVAWEEINLASETEPEPLLPIHEALQQLEASEPTAADAFGISHRSATRLWAFARARLLTALQQSPS